MTEAHEIASNIPTTKPLTFIEAGALVREHVGTPQDIGHQMFDNIAAALSALSRRLT